MFKIFCKFFCKHEWKLIQNITTESHIEHIKHTLGTDAVRRFTIYRDNIERKNIVILSCNKCGKLKRFVENV